MNKFPDDETGNTLSLFEENGFDLSRPLEMDFFVAVPSERSGVKVAERVREIGFQVTVEKDEETAEWTCYCTKKMVPGYAEVVSVEKELDKIARIYGGRSDGFGSYGNQ